jgi:lysozyme
VTIALLAAKLIQSFEGCKLTAYWDPTGKVWTIGFGHTKKVTNGDTITFDQAVALFEQDSAPLIALVQDRPLVEAAALVSFGYNCGIGALMSVIAGRIKIEDEHFIGQGGAPYGEVSGGVPLPGLRSRRQLEAALVEASRGGNAAA